MKKTFFSIVLSLFFTHVWAQNPTPNGFNYQAVIRDQQGILLINKINVVATISLRKDPAPGANVFWQENQTGLSTNGYGQLAFVIGELAGGGGTTVNLILAANSPFTKFEEINFTAGYWVKVEVIVPGINNGAVFTISDAKFQTVPYSRWAANGVPPGTIMAFGGEENKIPKGWRLCDGSAFEPTEKDPVSGMSLADLYAAISFSWGKVGTKFNLPDLRGQFLRGVSKNSGADPDVATRTPKPGGNAGNNVGSYQDYTIQKHSHKTDGTEGSNSHPVKAGQDAGIDWFSGNANSNDAWYMNGSRTGDTGGSETRPKNAYIHYIIKL